jgi:hypothetical protein
MCRAPCLHPPLAAGTGAWQACASSFTTVKSRESNPGQQRQHIQMSTHTGYNHREGNRLKPCSHQGTTSLLCLVALSAGSWWWCPCGHTIGSSAYMYFMFQNM